MAVKWTNEQTDVINSRGRNTLVSAAAGSGKTAVLVEHIISLVTDAENPIDIDRILVVTFTRAAAAEMRERILSAIESQSARYPENEHLQRQETYIHSADITTIDSFCMKVVQEYFDELDMDPGFRIGDEGELRLIMSDVMDEMLEEYYENGTEDFYTFVDEFANGKTDRSISDCVLNLYNFVSSRPDPSEWLDECRSDYNISEVQELKNSKWIQYLEQYADDTLKEQRNKVLSALDLCHRYDEIGGYTRAIEEAHTLIRRLLELDFDSRVNELAGVTFTKLGGVKHGLGDDIEAVRAAVKNVRDRFKDTVASLKSDIYYAHLDDLLSDIEGCRASVNVLIDLTLDFMERFKNRKIEKNIVDFMDIEHYAYKILVDRDENGARIPSARARELADKYYEIIVDEYQDSNLLQEYILTSVQGGRGVPNIFMVGDVKQSIYGFRNANPELFIEKYNTYEDSDKTLYFKKCLGKNFRSRAEIIDSANAVFERIMNKGLGGIEYDGENCLYEGAGYPDAPGQQNQDTEIICIENGYSSGAKAEYEAYVIAKKILELMNPDNKFQVYDKKNGEYRGIKYRDIVILARDIKNIADTFSSVFSQIGIPVYVERKTGYLDSTEIQTMLSLLTVINNPLDDIPLAAVMKSPIYGFTSMDFAEICAQNRCEYFYDSVAAYMENGENDALRDKITVFIGKLKAYRKIVPYTPIYDLIEMLFEDTNYYNYVAAMPDGRQRSKNLDILYDKAVAYDDGSYKGLFKFVKYIENIKNVNFDYGEASVLGENDDIVRIMTIHKSKGLQFPVVFIAGLGSAFMNRDLSDSILFHSSLGIGIDNIDSVLKIKSGTIIKSAIKCAKRKEKYAEETRVLYVAMTRAEEKLFLTASLKRPDAKIAEKQSDIDEEIVSVNTLLSATSFADMILTALKGRSLPDRHINISVEIENPDYRDDYMFMRGIPEIKSDVGEGQDCVGCDMANEIKERIGFEYAYTADTEMQSKTSVSKLKVRAMEYNPGLDGTMLINDEYDMHPAEADEGPEPVRPEFITGRQRLTGADRGTAYHRVFEIFDFSIEPTEENIRAMLDSLHDNGRIDDDTYDVVEVQDLMTFANSSLGMRMRAAAYRGRLFREQPFVMGIPADAVDEKCSSGELVLVQGIIDVCFDEDGEMVIADYKTDNVSNIEELADRYRVQLDYYERAIKKVTGKNVKEKIIYSVKLGKELIL